MSRVRIATFNIYFFGHRGSGSSGPKVVRDELDLQMLATIVADLDADVIVFQEIHDRDLLKRVLDGATALRPGRSWGIAAASHAAPVNPYQVVVAVDSRRVALVAKSTPITAVQGSRRPVVVELKVEGSSAVQVIAVHMKSGLLGAAPHESSAQRRATECRRLLDWMAGASATQRVVVGDFNALPTHPSITALRGADGWNWPPHRWPPEARRWTTHLDSFDFDPCAIDHIGLFGLEAEALNVHCFDLDNVRTRDGVTWRAWLDTDQDDEARLKRVSDHRPAFVDIELHP